MQDCPFSPQKIIELKNGSFVFVGYPGMSCEGHHGFSDLALMKTDSVGNLIWQKLYGSPGIESFNSFMHTSDGGYLITGTSNSSSGDIPFHYGDSFTTDAILIKTDSLGNLTWLKVFGGSNYDGFGGDPIEIDSNIFMLSIGTVSDDFDLADSPIAGPKRWIIKVDGSGNIIQENFIDPEIDFLNRDGQTDLIHAYYASTGQGWASSSYYPTFPDHLLEEGAIAFFDTATLELVDMRQWGGSGLDQLVKHVRDENGNFYFLGASTSTDYDLPGNYNNGGTSDYWLMATDSNFNLLWSRNFGGSDHCGDHGCSGFVGTLLYNNNMLYAFVKSTTDIIPDYDIECGHPSATLNFGFTDAWLVAFDITTVSVPDIAIPYQKIFTLYPNPAADKLEITSNGLSYPNIEIRIFDIQSRTIYQQSFLYSELISINTNKFPNGLYVVHIYSDQKQLLQVSEIVIQKP